GVAGIAQENGTAGSRLHGLSALLRHAVRRLRARLQHIGVGTHTCASLVVALPTQASWMLMAHGSWLMAMSVCVCVCVCLRLNAKRWTQSLLGQQTRPDAKKNSNSQM